MRPLTDRRPKPLLPVGDRSLLERVFDAAIDVVEFVVVTGYHGDAIRETIGESYRSHPLSYVRQAAAKERAHAAAQAAPVVDGDFLVLNGDVIVDASLPRALADAEGMALAATEVPDPRAYGVLSTAEDGSLAGIVEKPDDSPTNLANVANLRHDDATVRLTLKSDRGGTGRRKLGAIVGDDAKTGINTSLNAGVKLGVEATIRPGEAVTRDRDAE